mgnify:CR=1 FL=1
MTGSDSLSPLRLAGALLSFVGVAVVIESGPGFGGKTLDAAQKREAEIKRWPRAKKAALAAFKF